MSTPQLAAVLIVRDESALLPACLESLAGVVDEIHVHDTGSRDDSAVIATRHGAYVTHGGWSDDFGAARNEAASRTTADWVLAVDADHRVTADPAALRRAIAGADRDALLVEVYDAHHAAPYRQLETRLYRPAAVGWQGRVHERLVRPDGSAPDRGTVPSTALGLVHLGYATHADRVRRAKRNLELTRRMLDELTLDSADQNWADQDSANQNRADQNWADRDSADRDSADRERIAATLLALGRDCAAAERWQRATDTFETLRELFPGTPEWLQATDALARLVLASGYDRLCLVLADQLREAGAARDYCDWLSAQALAQLGEPHAAGLLLDGITEVVDTAGRRHEPAALRELITLVSRLRTLAPQR